MRSRGWRRLDARFELRWRDQFLPHSTPTPPGNTTTGHPFILSLSEAKLSRRLNGPRKAPGPRTSARCAAPGRGGTAADAKERSEDNFCSMKITQEVRDFAAKQNAGVESFLAAEEMEKGMEEMSRVYNEGGRELYIGQGDREHD